MNQKDIAKARIANALKSLESQICDSSNHMGEVVVHDSEVADVVAHLEKATKDWACDGKVTQVYKDPTEKDRTRVRLIWHPIPKEAPKNAKSKG